MSNEVYANGNEIACKSGDDKVIAAFPDVCLSPPSPPAGPIPVPYPNTSFSKDTKEGSKTVKINGNEVMLKDSSYYKTSPLGDEAATNGLGASVVTHVITGKTYFVAWSMDVKFEDENVDRHLDLTSSNHASYPGSPPPVSPALEASNLALNRLKVDECPCCGNPGGKCPAALSKAFPNGAKREAYSHREFYRLDETKPDGTLTALAAKRQQDITNNPCAKGDCPNADNSERKSKPPCDVYRVTTTEESTELSQNRHCPKQELRDHHKIPKAKGAIKGFFKNNPSGRIMNMDKAAWDAKDIEQQNKVVQLDHVTPRAAGGCPGSKNNTQPHGSKCDNCKKMDEIQDSWNNQELTSRRNDLGIN